ncbi:hypothetical protein PMAYCL1PPCAC_01741, partial [Pristionchus mayeri]
LENQLEQLEKENKDLRQRAEKAEKNVEGLNKSIIGLTNLLSEERIRSFEDRKRELECRLRDKERINELSIQLAQERNRANDECMNGLKDRLIDQERMKSITKQVDEMMIYDTLKQKERMRMEAPAEENEMGVDYEGPGITPCGEDKCEKVTPASNKTLQLEVGWKLEVAKDKKKEDEPEKKFDELCREMVEPLKNNPTKYHWHNAIEILSRMSKMEEYPGKEMFGYGIVPLLVKGLSVDVVKSGAIGPLIRLMTHSNDKLAEEATEAVGEIADQSEQIRDLVLKNRVTEALTTLCDKLPKLPISFVREIADTYAKICCPGDSISQMSIEVLGVMVPSLFRLLNYEDREVRENMLATLTHITYETDQCKIVFNSGFLPLVFKNLNDDHDQIVENALMVFDNMAQGDDTLMQAVFDMGGLDVLPALMRKKAGNANIIRCCCWIIESVLGGTEGQKQAAIDKGLLTMIIKIMRTGESECRKLCCRAVATFVKKGTVAHIKSVIEEKPMSSLAAMLTLKGEERVHEALEVIEKLLVTANPKQLKTLKEEAKVAGVIWNIKKLQENGNNKVRNLAMKILSEYFTDDIEVVNVSCEKKGNSPNEKKKVKRMKH